MVWLLKVEFSIIYVLESLQGFVFTKKNVDELRDQRCGQDGLRVRFVDAAGWICLVIFLQIQYYLQHYSCSGTNENDLKSILHKTLYSCKIIGEKQSPNEFF